MGFTSVNRRFSGASVMRMLTSCVRRCYHHTLRITKMAEEIMAWKTPKIVEIALGAEINSYACAGLT